jgi:endonuclease G
MKTLILLSILAILFSFSKTPLRKDVLVKTNIFTAHYSEVYEQPLNVSYVVECTETKFSRKGLDFVTNDSIHTSNDADYQNNQWDKGHLAPAADFACDKQKLASTFTYLNCALQHQDLNRGVWKELEEHERMLAKQELTEVTVQVNFSAKSVKLKSGATIPDSFIKIIKHGKTIEKYFFPNVSPTKPKFTDYSIN